MPQRGDRGRTVRIADTSAQDVELAPRSHRNRNLGIAAIVLVVLLLGWVFAPAVSRWANASVTVPYERVRIAQVARGDLVRDVSIQGRVVAAVSPTLYAPAAGSIALHVEAGASVEEGQILAVVDSPELTSRLRQAESVFEKQSMELERQRIEARQLALEKRKAADLAEVALIAANREKRRADEANELSVISKIDFEKAQDDLRNAELAHEHAVADADLFDERLAFELKASELELRRQRLLTEELRRQVGALSIRSPVGGIVGDLLVEQKAAVARDLPVMAVVDLSRFEVNGEVPESYADDLGLGMAAEIIIGTESYAGEVVAVSPEIVNAQVATRIRFTDVMPQNLRQNQRLTTRILIEERPGVLMLQRGQFLETGGGRVAYVLDGEGLAIRRQITVGARSLGAVEIIDGLEAGDEVIISSIDQFRSAETVLLTD